MTGSPPGPRSLRPGLRVYAIGDVHGCLRQLLALHAAIQADLDARPVSESLLIHLGDYIDRGRDSAGVVALLCGTVTPRVTRRVDLPGNHESMMLSAILGGEPDLARLWLDNGGEATLASYGVARSAGPDGWASAIPPAHIGWMKSLDLFHVEEPYLFVHAGIRPGRPIAEQQARDLLWIREPFLSWQEPQDFRVVHGHTPSRLPNVLPNRIGIDTGAVFGGVLTCAVLEEGELTFLSA